MFTNQTEPKQENEDRIIKFPEITWNMILLWARAAATRGYRETILEVGKSYLEKQGRATNTEKK